MAGVYVSYPFCAQKCTYCNFASGVASADLERAYGDALEREIRAHAWLWRPETVYLGGGTPSRLPAPSLARILDAIPGRPWLEATIEAAPGTVSEDAAREWLALGLNRVSLGVQSFVERELAATGRKHSAATVAREVDALRAAGLRRINIDLIAGLPYQTKESWGESLDWIRRLEPDHVSVYILEVDEDSRLGAEILRHGTRYGAARAPAADEAAEWYEMAVERLAAIGIQRYEISNFARPGSESAHNLKYWRLEPYAGFGADAHSFDGTRRRANAERPADYLRLMNERGSACVNETVASPEEERFFVSLRLSEGVPLSAQDWARFSAQIGRFREGGLVTVEDGRLRLTSRGVLLSNEIFQEFLT